MPAASAHQGARYTADGTVGEAGAASRCGQDLELTPDDAGAVIVDRPSPLCLIDRLI